MAEATSTTINDIQVADPVPNFDFVDPFTFSTEAIAAILALVVAFHFYRFYKVSGFVYLLGLAVGFLAIAFAEIMLAVGVWLEPNLEIYNMLFWLRLLSLSYGFSFVAMSYHYKHRDEDRTPWIMRVIAISVIPIVIVTTLVILTPPAFDFPAYNRLDEYFGVLNLVMLGYVFKSSLDSIVTQGRKEFIYIPAAFAILWLGQYSALIFDLDRNVSSFVAEHIAKILGLALFVGVLAQIRRGKKIAKTNAE
jgi:hypothetical protein